MAARKGQKQGDLGRAALRGAAAGMAGALVVTLIEREILSRLAGGKPHRSDFDDEAAGAVRRFGPAIGGRTSMALGIAGQMLYGGVLGAAYAVAHEQTRDSRAGRTLVDGVMTYAASFVFPDVPQPKRSGRKRALRKKLVKPANPAATFSKATALALRALGE